ncbi:MAG: type II toxin-antitoxin system VapC family toxin [Vicinamibacteria bacterium]
MIVYLDASALVKRYIAESASKETNQLIDQAEAVGTAALSRAEVSAALAKAARVGLLSDDSAAAVLQVFRAQWTDLLRLQITETLIAKADSLAWDYGLRGYHAVHLSAALVWEEALGESILLATFDRQLKRAGQQAGIAVWPN